MIYEKSVVALQPDPATQGVCPTWHERAAVAAERRITKPGSKERIKDERNLTDSAAVISSHGQDRTLRDSRTSCCTHRRMWLQSLLR